MIPKTLSASSLKVADTCLARWKAENLEYTPRAGENKAANVGTAVHFGLEKYVESVYIKKEREPSLELLLFYYQVGYLETFDTVETNTPEFKDGKALTEKWFHRTDLSGVTVLSVETKTRFPLPTSAGDIPLTYIWDRCDYWEEDGRRIIRIVDYKTIRAYKSHEMLRNDLQCRLYDLMARTQFKDNGIDEFQVEFDLLRHEPVTVIFSADDAADCWYKIIARAERILATPEDNPPETLNPECGYCVRKLSCATLQKNIAGGGMFTAADIKTATEMRYNLANQAKGLDAAIAELDTLILAHAQGIDATSFPVDDEFKVTISATKRRSVDSHGAASVLGPELMTKYGSLNVSDIDELIKDGAITPTQAEQLKRYITFKVGAPTVKITKVTK